MLLELDGEGPLYQQTVRALRAAILEGRLPAGARLPATRTLARECAVSRNTILLAYEQLTGEGYLRARRGSGTYVATQLPETLRPIERGDAVGADAPAFEPLRLSSHAGRVVEGAPRRGVSWAIPRKRLPYDFRYGEPGYADLPLETWCRLLGRRARRASVSRLAYGEPSGARELREALVGHLSRARGVSCEPDQIVITHGSQQAIDLLMRMCVDPGDVVALEEPHYGGLSLALGAYGAERVAIPVDEDGLRVDLLTERANVRGVCVTPSHQFPTGAILSLDRRLALLAWAEERGAFVLEDDYDGEYRYEGRPIPSLQGLDRAGRVFYVGTASKMLFPSLRIGWLIVPPEFVRVAGLCKAYADTGGATLEQLVLADFIEAGHLDSHVRRTRVRYGARREALHAAVERHLGGRASLMGTRAGLHGLLWVPGLPSGREGELRREAASRGVGIYPLYPYTSEPPPSAGYVLGFSAMTEDDIEEGIRLLGEALDAVVP